MNRFFYPRRNNQQQGFTLIEVLLALGLTAMLLGLLSTGVYVVANDWNRNSDVLDQSLDQALSILQLERALLGAFPHSYTDPQTLSRNVYFEGEDERLNWVSTVSPQRIPGLMTWSLYADTEGVWLSLVPAFSDNPRQRLEEATPQLLLPGYDIEFRYLYQEPTLDEARLWQDEWQGDDLQSLPLAVHVLFTPQNTQGNSDQPLEIVARINSFQHRNLRPNTLLTL